MGELSSVVVGGRRKDTLAPGLCVQLGELAGHAVQLPLVHSASCSVSSVSTMRTWSAMAKKSAAMWLS